MALKHGHRTSIDLDLFYNEKFEREPIIKELQNVFGGEFEFEGDKSRWGIFCYAEEIKVDIVYYPHPFIKKMEVQGGIRMYSDEDRSNEANN